MDTILEFLSVLFKHYFQGGTSQKSDLTEQNWYNQGSNYKERKIAKVTSTPDPIALRAAPSFYSPVDLDIPYVTCKYGWRELFGKGKGWNWHTGVDLRARQGTPAFAIEDCEVVEIVKLKPNAKCRFKYNPKTRSYIDLKNGAVTPRVALLGKRTGYLYFYKHCQIDPFVKIGQFVSAGNKVGHFGDYGYSMASHCHLELLKPIVAEPVFSANYNNCFKRYNPVKIMKKEFGFKFTGKLK